MKATSVTRLRADTTRLMKELRDGADEPVLVLQNAEIAAYLVSPKLWDALQAELKRLRERNRELFWEGIEDAEREAERGELKIYDSVDEMFADRGLAVDDDAQHDAA
jgi:PHD/YefM family antitoxin component YafN of YafNO toxin-antitoxin module